MIDSDYLIFADGESHLYLGRQYRLKLLPGESAGVKLARGHLLVCLPGEPDQERVKALLHRWYLVAPGLFSVKCWTLACFTSRASTIRA